MQHMMSALIYMRIEKSLLTLEKDLPLPKEKPLEIRLSKH